MYVCTWTVSQTCSAMCPAMRVSYSIMDRVVRTMQPNTSNFLFSDFATLNLSASIAACNKMSEEIMRPGI